ncbi:MAG: hypothetical protein PQJ49_05035 [Sphaerochaetaceae bacterium]|nr:hypothetical protein [Sphaerochaetaceae bacterium]
MINQIQTVITVLSTFPDRPNYTSARAYATAVAIWLKENKELSQQLSTLVPELNNAIKQINKNTSSINEISLILNGLANYKGEWVATDENENPKVYNQADSVTHNGVNYISKIDNNIDMPPSANWQRITIDNTIAETTRSFEENEEVIINFHIPRDNPEVVVKKEVIDEGLINTTMDVDGSNYIFKDYSLDTTLTPSGVTGNITLTLGSGNFTTDHIGMIVEGNGGKAVILGTDGTASVTSVFHNTNEIASGDWSLIPLVQSPEGISIAQTSVYQDGSQDTICSLPETEEFAAVLSSNYIVTASRSRGLITIQDKLGNVKYTYSPLSSPAQIIALFENAEGNIVLVEFYSHTLSLTVFSPELILLKPKTNIATAGYTNNQSVVPCFHYDKTNDNFYVCIESYNTSYAHYDVLHGFNASYPYNALWTGKRYFGTTNRSNAGHAIAVINSTVYFTYWYSNSSASIFTLYGVSVAQSSGTTNVVSTITTSSYYENHGAMIEHKGKLIRIGTRASSYRDSTYMELNTSFSLLLNQTRIKQLDTLYHGDFRSIVKDEHASKLYLMFNTGYMIIDINTYDILKDETLYTGYTDLIRAEGLIQVTENGDIVFFIKDNTTNKLNLVKFATGTKKYSAINNYHIAIADSTINTNFFTDFNSMTITESLNGQIANYFFSFDEKNTWCIFIGGVIRNIVRNNNGTWEYNTDNAYENETWTVASENDMFSALEEAVTITANHMSVSNIAALTDEQYPEPKIKFNFGMALYTDNADEIPTSNGLVSINYDANSRWEKVPDAEYTYSMLDEQNLRFKALTANNLKIRIM